MLVESINHINATNFVLEEKWIKTQEFFFEKQLQYFKTTNEATNHT
jgi:hypothetical protein